MYIIKISIFINEMSEADLKYFSDWYHEPGFEPTSGIVDAHCWGVS